MMAASKTAVLLLFSIGFSVFYLLGLSTLSSGAALVQPTAATNQVHGNNGRQQKCFTEKIANSAPHLL